MATVIRGLFIRKSVKISIDILRYKIQKIYIFYKYIIDNVKTLCYNTFSSKVKANKSLLSLSFPLLNSPLPCIAGGCFSYEMLIKSSAHGITVNRALSFI